MRNGVSAKPVATARLVGSTATSGRRLAYLSAGSSSGGTAIPFHSHNCEESVVLLSGHAYLDIDGEVQELKPLDTTFIPPNVPHRFRNMSDTEPMKILWIYASVNATRTLVETGETRPVAAEHAK